MRPGMGREDLRPSAHRVVRGGSFDFDENFLRAADRGNFFPDFRLNIVGFRVVGQGRSKIRPQRGGGDAA